MTYRSYAIILGIIGIIAWNIGSHKSPPKPPYTILPVLPVNAVITFDTVKPIFAKKCYACHHQPHWNWTNYDTAFRNRKKIKLRVWTLRTMPMGMPITEAERTLIKDWVDGGGQK